MKLSLNIVRKGIIKINIIILLMIIQRHNLLLIEEIKVRILTKEAMEDIKLKEDPFKNVLKYLVIPFS